MPVISALVAGAVLSTDQSIAPNGSNRCAFLDMIAWSEIGPELLRESDNGYNVLVGSTPSNPDLFTSYASHPDKLVRLNATLSSTAAGRYQLLYRYWVDYSQMLGLYDFEPLTQDKIALQQIRERHALELIDQGNIQQAIKACSNIWASLPGGYYGQPIHTVADLQWQYQQAGGLVA